MSPAFSRWFFTGVLCARFAHLTAAPAWESHSGYRTASLTVPASGKAGFSEVASSATGIVFANRLDEERSLTNQIFLNGSGVAAGDVDGDGLCDLYFGGLDSPNALYRNLGNWRFQDITAAAGVACADQASTGATLADIDGDGDLDLLVNGIQRGTRLFLNDGHARFREVTDATGLRGTSGSTSFALADIDGDGFLDLYVVNYRNDTMRDMPDLRFRFSATNGVSELRTVNGRPANAPEWLGRFSFDQASGVLENGQPDVLYRNDGQGHFHAVSWTNGVFLDEAGQAARVPYDWGLSAMFRDLDGDGAPDLYVCNDFQSPDRIWMNDGHGHFRAASSRAIRHTSLFSMGIDVADINRDGLDDIFVADMLSRDYRRRQVQVMDAAAFAQFRSAGGARPQFPRNTLFLNRGNGTYSEIAQFAGVDASDWSWCPVFLDVDLDGFEDLLVTTGHWRDAQNADISREIEDEKKRRSLSPLEQLRLRNRFPRLRTPNAAFRNRGDLTFEETAAAWGFDSTRISQGMALADLDNDGDLDVVINCLNDGPLLYRNESPRPRIAVRLRGTSPNTRGIGAKIRVLAPGLPPQSQEMICGGRYLSGDDSIRAFATGQTDDGLTIEVAWRSGKRSLLRRAQANRIYEIDEAGAEAVPTGKTNPPNAAASAADLPSTSVNRPASVVSGPSSVVSGPTPTATVANDALRMTHDVSRFAIQSPLFQDVSDRLAHTHHDDPFDDFARQPLLPHSLSELGPGVTWFDFNDDGWDDLLIGTGRGGRLAVYRNTGKGEFIPQKAKVLESPAERDFTTVLGWHSMSNHPTLVFGLATDEDLATNAPSLRLLSLVTGGQRDDLLRAPDSIGPLAMADFDNDGDLDVFVGGRVVPGRFPEPASSFLLRNDSGQLRFDPEASGVLASVGMVSGAVFSDLGSDGWPELVVACEWGPIRVFRNSRGKFRPWNPPLTWPNADAHQIHCPTLDSLTGWWNSVAAGDFDNDGRLDLVAGNWGRNTARERYRNEPLELFFGAVPGANHIDLLEAVVDPLLKRKIPFRDFGVLRSAFSVLNERFQSFAAFSEAGVSDLLSAGLPPMQQVKAAVLDSVLLLNRGDSFEVRPLPAAAQMAPVFGVAIGDLDGDGAEDIFLAQNFYGVAASESRHDAGCGVMLRGNGAGEFVAIPPHESGLFLEGEGRGAALCDFDHDGRLDLLVGQNRGTTKLYCNVRATPGLRIRLGGPAENPQAIGAVVRLQFRDGRFGPAHELHLGGGYWSQDSAEVVLGLPREPAELDIRWPGGPTERVPITQTTGTFIRRSVQSVGK